jgi:hypothetical protein
LDDLIVGAHGVDLSGKSNAGKSYVIQIIQAITVDITCVGDYATNITRILTVDSKALY